MDVPAIPLRVRPNTRSQGGQSTASTNPVTESLPLGAQIVDKHSLWQF